MDGQVTRGILIESDRGSRVEGQVTDPEGNLIAGATVETFFFTNRPTVTGPDGCYAIDGLSPVVNAYSLNVTHLDYAPVSLEFSPGAAGETVYQDVVLQAGIDVRRGPLSPEQGQCGGTGSLGGASEPCSAC